MKLDSFLKLTGLAPTGGAAKHMIKDGRVKLNGEVHMQRSSKLQPGDIICVEGVGRLKVVKEE